MNSDSIDARPMTLGGEHVTLEHAVAMLDPAYPSFGFVEINIDGVAKSRNYERGVFLSYGQADGPLTDAGNGGRNRGRVSIA